MIRPGTESSAMSQRVNRRRACRGFTLVELMITLTVLAVVMIVLMTVLQSAQRSKTGTSNQIEASQAARAAMDLLTRDLRSAGYGADRYWLLQPQPPIAYIDSLQVLINANFQPFPDDTVPDPPLAYQPAGAPRPFPLNGTPWQPPIKYRFGAEVVRWTLDVNNDGQVNAADVASANGVDARRTPNPDDYVLVREVYGDSTGDIANFNGGQAQRIALVRKPGSGVPPMFQVYLAGIATPWDWAAGPIPASELSRIERITVQVAAPSSRPDSKGRYAETRLKTEINSMRNVPNFGEPEFVVDGYVFDDNVTQNLVKDAGEPGLAGTSVHLGPYSTTTGANGYFLFSAVAGTYTLRHQPPSGYGAINNPDSVVITVGPAATFSFADSARAGGFVEVFVYEDKDQSGTYDVGEAPLPSARVTMSPGGEFRYTDAAGNAKLFAPEGAYTVTATPLDSFMVTTVNPYSGSMPDGGSASIQFGMVETGAGTISGHVFRDNNRNGLLDAGENGLSNVWVGVTPDGGSTVYGFAYTDASGAYSMTVPANDPPGTTPYTIMAIVPPGYYPTSTTTIYPVLVQDGQTITDKNFGMLGYQVIVLNASRVLSLASGDLIEKDWNGNQTQNARKDADLVLGADAGGTDNVSVWFNDYDTTPLFDANPTYTRNAPQSVLSLALDTLDTNSPKLRLDAVTGTRNAAAGNFFVWFNQNSSGNEGYFPTAASQSYRTADNGDVQSALTLDCAGGAGADQVDIIVGAKSPTAGQGTIEIWTSDNAATPSFARLETYPPAGAIPGNALGEVNVMALADINSDGKKDLLVGTRTGSYTGQLMIFRNNGKGAAASRFTLAQSHAILGVVTAIAATKVDADTLTDIVIGVQTGFANGELQEFKNRYLAGMINFTFERKVATPGIVLALLAADLGGEVGQDDLAMGWRENETSYVGGIRVFPLDAKRVTISNSDPSAGSIINMVPALTTNNFNYGVKPSVPSPPYLSDLAAGVKVTALTGALVVFIR